MRNQGKTPGTHRSPSYRKIPPQFDIPIQRWCFAEALLLRQSQALHTASERDVVQYPEIELGRLSRLSLKSLERVDLKVNLSADSFANATLQPIRSHRQPKVHTDGPLKVHRR